MAFRREPLGKEHSPAHVRATAGNSDDLNQLERERGFSP